MYFSPEPPKPTLLRTPGSVASASRMLLLDRLLADAAVAARRQLIVSVALRASARADCANGSPPVAAAADRGVDAA